MSNIWTYQHPQNSNWQSKTAYQKLQDQYRQSRSPASNKSPKCLNYRIIRTEHKFENYFLRMPPKMRKSFIDYRLCNNKLPIEIHVCRWVNIDRSPRKCNLCNSGTVGDEIHYVLECCFFNFDRKSFYHISTGNLFEATYAILFNDTNFRRLRRLCNFSKIVIDTFRSHSRLNSLILI